VIVVTRRTGESVYVNPDLIETMEANPDTLLTLVGGERLMVCESPEQVLERIREWRHRGGRAVGPAALSLIARSGVPQEGA
jgi:flagellar protein FlbD